MRQSLSVILAVVVLLLGGATLFFYSQLRTSQSSNVSLQSASQNTQTQYARTLDAIAEIQDSLNAIALGDKRMPFESSSLHAERQMGAPSAQEALERIGLLRASIERNKERIQRLERDLHSSGLRVAGLQRLVESLRTNVMEKERQVAELAAQVDTLHTQVGTLSTQVAQVQDTVRARDVVLADRQRDLATIYYVAGSKSTLARSGVIEARGGLLGLGKTLRPVARIPDDHFHLFNTDEETVIRLPGASAKAQVLTAQPVSSYELRPVLGGMELHILSPRDFRTVRQLVIVTA